MPRVRRGNRRLQYRKKILKRAKGFYGARGNLYRTAELAVERASLYAYQGRKLRKRDFRQLWIVRINAAARLHDLSYSRFVAGLKTAGVEINRKILADMAVHDPTAFGELAEVAKKSL